ncbi:hypothetical protein [Thermogemmatispora tikiterensis]|uniref:Uncharacterized protein n=1 Tax=Thermogemmatispora tikiterensis TaxID=1825093 RepID=A0A328VIF4_9CHLR|nr:hypothetical protein [Thermogemmatispora tikiterensis]RAQ94065.1 hypothetical protein A4R35_00875 [Thermogemmatispora tikiterensis]
MLPRLVRQAGFLDVRLRAAAIEWSMGTEQHYPVFKDLLIGLELILPFLERQGLATRAALTTLYQQAVAEMQDALLEGTVRSREAARLGWEHG